MARINIEDRLYKDGRFTDLCIKLGSKWTALGALFEAWALAQDFVAIDNPAGLMAIEVWKKRRMCDLIIEVGLAEIKDGQIYLCGAEEQFAWLVQSTINGNKGGRPKNPPVTQGKPAGNPGVSLGNPLTLSLSPSSEKLINSSSKAGTANVDNPAALCLLAVQRFGPDERDALREFVGDQLYERVRTTCGWPAVREMKRDNFAIMNLTRNLGTA